MGISKKYLNNSKGLTLVEVLATLVISSIALTLIWNIFISGISTSNNIQYKNFVQQESNIVTQHIRTNHLTNDSYTLQINENNILLNNTPISTEYSYTSTIIYGGVKYTTGDFIDVTAKSPMLFNLVIKTKDNKKDYEIRTTIQKQGE
jgi:prepilin-type N-terminal cleavage/methylation domain-containing protein